MTFSYRMVERNRLEACGRDLELITDEKTGDDVNIMQTR